MSTRRTFLTTLSALLLTARLKADEARAVLIEKLNAALTRKPTQLKSRYYALPDNIVRYELTTPDTHTVGAVRQTWVNDRLQSQTPLTETKAQSPEPLFRDVTAHAFRATPSFHEQLAKGNPHWRAQLDPALGIDIYANNGISAADIDNDGQDEIYVCQQGGLPNRLYKWRPGNQLEDITAQSGLDILDDCTCALFADFRNSGHQDLVLLRGAGPLLFLNDGQGRFQLAPDAFHFQTPAQGSFTGMAAADYNRDGKLDLYLCCYVYFQSEDQYRYPAPYHDAQNGPPNFLFRNQLEANGAGHFLDVTEATGMNHNNNRYSFAPAWCDFDGDGWPDLYVANDFGRNNLYRNRKGRFRDEAAELGVEDIGPGMSASWFDYDGDGRPDLYVSNMWSAPGQRVTHDPAFPKDLPTDPYRHHCKGNSLYRNTGDGKKFEDVGAQQNVEMGRWAWSSAGFDFDNDRRPEILIAAGMLTGDKTEPDLSSFFWTDVVSKSPPKLEPAPAYENGWNTINQRIREGQSWCGSDTNMFYVRKPEQTRYVDYSGVSGFDFADDTRSFAVTDIDGDGNLDIVLKSRLGPQVRVLQNNSTKGRRSIAVKLIGTKSNRDAIGACVEFNGQTKYVEAGSGYLSQHTKTLHFAVLQQGGVSLQVTWPSGEIQLWNDLPPGYIELTESAQFAKTKPLGNSERWPAIAVNGQNEAIFTETWLAEPVPLPDKRKRGFVSLIDGQPLELPTDIPLEQLDIKTNPVLAATYGLFRRYLFDYRTGLTTPTLLLVDDESRAQKFYARIPHADVLRADLTKLDHPELAVPFPGRYCTQPARGYYKLGAAFYQAGYPEQAIPYLAEAVRRAPGNWKAWMAMGQLHADAGRHREAVEAFNHVLEIQPNRPAALVLCGESEAKLGNLDRAVSLFKDALTADPKNSGALNNLAVSYMKQGKPNDAIAALQYGIEVAPDDDQLYMNLGRIYVAGGDREKARAVMQQLLDRKPNDPTALHALQELNSR